MARRRRRAVLYACGRAVGLRGSLVWLALVKAIALCWRRFGSYNSACSSRPVVGALLRRVSDCAPLSVMLQRFCFAHGRYMLVSYTASAWSSLCTAPAPLSPLRTTSARIRGVRTGTRERLAQHLCALLGSQRCSGCSSARSETCEGRRRLVVAAQHDGSGPVAPAARRGRLHGTGTSTSPAHATISVRRQEGGRRRRRARQRALLSSKLDFARHALPERRRRVHCTPHATDAPPLAGRGRHGPVQEGPGDRQEVARTTNRASSAESERRLQSARRRGGDAVDATSLIGAPNTGSPRRSSKGRAPTAP